ncbi:FAD-dependent monooxygenase [Kineococcus glutinatus]|uniref:FAD-dependent oxidoreductase n=1 Tax=Kineococcus glutinatus TaxID=1070872 RepID=A0ABP9I3Z3_9ACTN
MTAPPQVPAGVPVLIAGGGPAGLAAALELAHHGIASLVVEPRTTVDADRPRAKTTNARTMTHLRRWGIADRLRAAAPLPVSYAQDVVFCSTLLGREVFRFTDAFQLSALRPAPHPEHGQQVPQPVVEEVLREAVRASAAAQLLLGARVTGLGQDGDGVAVRVGTADGAMHTVRARYVLGCDGSSGVVRPAVGARYEGGSGARPNLSVLFRAPGLAERVPSGPAVQHWVLAPGAAGLVGRADLADTWWAILQGVDDPASVDVPAALRALVGDPRLDPEVVATDPWTARMLLADRYRAGRVLLVGDAAHLNPPWGGHGYNTCVGDAVNVAWKLAGVLQGWAGEDLLDSYEAERRPVAARTIADAAANDRFLATAWADARLGADGADADALRARTAIALEAKRSEFHSLGLVLGYSYASSPVVVDDGSPLPKEDPVQYSPSARPGCLLPHRWLRDGSSVYDRLGRGFTLLAVGDAPADPAEVVRASSPGPSGAVPLDVVRLGEQDLEPGSAPLPESWEAPLLLVRPDQHVAWRGDRLADHAPALLRAVGR